MAQSWIENVAAEYFRKLGFLVLENISYFAKAPHKTQPVWQEIDVIAVSENETHIVSCKRGMSPIDYRKLPEYFSMHVNYLRTSKFSWALNRPIIEKALVIEHPRPKHVKPLEKMGINVISLRDVLYNYVKLLKDELEKEGKEGKEPDFVTRTIKGLFFWDIICLKHDPAVEQV